jgi:hypothetical protein
VYYPKYSTFEPLFTTRTLSTFGTVDYIWFTSENPKARLSIKCLADTPELWQLTRYKVLPNRIYPSDHFSLVVDFNLL